MRHCDKSQKLALYLRKRQTAPEQKLRQIFDKTRHTDWRDMALKSKEQAERERSLVLEDMEIAIYRTMVQQAKRLHELDRIVEYHLPNLIAKATPPALAKALRDAGAKYDIDKRTSDANSAACGLRGAIDSCPSFGYIPHEHAEKLHDIADAIDARLAQLIEENGGTFTDDRMTAFPYLISASEHARAKAERLEATVGKPHRSECSTSSGTATVELTPRTMEEQRKVAEAAEAAQAERKRRLEEFNRRNAVQAVPKRVSQHPPAKPLDEEVRERTAARIAEITG